MQMKMIVNCKMRIHRYLREQNENQYHGYLFRSWMITPIYSYDTYTCYCNIKILTQTGEWLSKYHVRFELRLISDLQQNFNDPTFCRILYKSVKTTMIASKDKKITWIFSDTRSSDFCSSIEFHNVEWWMKSYLWFTSVPGKDSKSDFRRHRKKKVIIFFRNSGDDEDCIARWNILNQVGKRRFNHIDSDLRR